ncbi:HAUS augmin-like complex subunit 1, partial [Apaloderma vittatum]
QVTLWLKKIYENQPIPQYEVSAETVDILYELAEYNEAINRDDSLLIEDMEQQATEYEEKTNYLQGLLEDSLGLSVSSLSSEGTRCLNALAESAMILETKDTSLASFFSAINIMTAELYATESKNREMAQDLSNIGKKLTEALMLEKKLADDLKQTEKFLEIEKLKADRRTQNLKFLQKKTEDMKKRIKAAEDQLAAAGLDQSLMHESLMSLSE